MTGWDHVPVDDTGYQSSAGLLTLPDDELRAIIDQVHVVRYTGWRNYEGRWRDLMGLDELHGRDILEFGCGIGLEAMELACRRNRVTVADIHPENVALAQRACRLYGCEVKGLLIQPEPQVFPRSEPRQFDVFYASGSLHHSRHPVHVMEQAAWLLRPGGEARLMLYSDRGWRLATGEVPPAGDRQKFTRFFDEVGDWADWYDERRLELRFGEWFTVERFAYLTPDDRYCAAVLRRKP